MLAAKNRLKKKNDFGTVIKKGEGFSQDLVLLKTTKNRKSRVSRFGIIISRKAVKSAVARNKIRRRFMAAIRSEFPAIKSNVDAVFIVKPGFRGNFDQIKKIIAALLKRAGAI